jgi:hypothetical protein
MLSTDRSDTADGMSKKIQTDIFRNSKCRVCALLVNVFFVEQSSISMVNPPRSPAHPARDFTNKKNNLIFVLQFYIFYYFRILFTNYFAIFKPRSTTGQMPPLVLNKWTKTVFRTQAKN